MRSTARIKPEPFVLDLHGAFIRRTDLSGANLTNANLSNADCTGVNFRGANLRGTILKGTILRGADLTNAKNLTVEQLAEAVIDDETVLPSYLPAKLQSLSVSGAE
ncbi:MAG: pentapeptide repeat-containing protein [Geminicoccaceae bacterium]|mgnify:CR=1 FL=1